MISDVKSSTCDITGLAYVKWVAFWLEDIFSALEIPKDRRVEAEEPACWLLRAEDAEAAAAAPPAATSVTTVP